MWFEINVDGINIKLQINGYRPTNEDNMDDKWCKCDFRFSSGDWLNYSIENCEVLLSSEVEDLKNKLSKLLDNELADIEELQCIEQDFIFKFYPQTDLKNESRCIYVRPGCEILDIFVEWEIYFYDGVVTGNCLSLTLDRDEIKSLRDYLATITN